MNEQQEEIVDYVVEDLGVDLNDPNLKGWDGTMGPVLPPGEYLVEVVNAAIEDKKSKEGRNLVLTLQVLTEGEHFGVKAKHWIPLPGPGDKPGIARRLAHVVRDTLEAPLLPSGGFQTASLIGRQMYITATLEESKEFDPARSQEIVRTRTRLQGERRVERAEPPKAASAPASKPPTTAQPAAKGRPTAVAQRR